MKIQRIGLKLFRSLKHATYTLSLNPLSYIHTYSSWKNPSFVIEIYPSISFEPKASIPRSFHFKSISEVIRRVR